MHFSNLLHLLITYFDNFYLKFRNWNNELKREKPNFTKAFVKAFASSFIVPFILFTIEVNYSNYNVFIELTKYYYKQKLNKTYNFFQKDCVIKTIQPILLGIVVRYFSSTDCDNENFLTTCMTSAGLCLSTFIVINCQHAAYISVIRTSMRAKIAWSALIYKKVKLLFIYLIRLISLKLSYKKCSSPNI